MTLIIITLITRRTPVEEGVAGKHTQAHTCALYVAELGFC